MRCFSALLILRFGLIGGLYGLVPGAVTSQAATVTFTDRTVFEAALPTGFYFNDFSGVPNAFSSPVSAVSGSGGTPSVGYEITAPTAGLGVFPETVGKAVGNWAAAENLIVTFNSGNVASAGGNIWLTDISGNRVAGTVNVSFSEGTSIPVSSTTSGGLGFAGITTTETVLTTLTLQAVGGGSFLNISNLSVAAVPEPGSLIVVGLTAASLAALARRQIRRASLTDRQE